jgi:hypothetical protein
MNSESGAMSKQERNDNNYFIYLMAAQSAIRQRIISHPLREQTTDDR